MENHHKFLKRCPLFFDIDENDLIKMLGCLGASVKKYEKRQTIFQDGSPASHLGIMLSGSAQIIQNDYFGNRIIISTVLPSELFAEEFACSKTDSMPVSIIAREPCEAMLIDCSRILHTCKNCCSFHHQMIYNLMKNLADKTLNYHQKIKITSKRTTREKLLAYLAFYAKKTGKSSFDIPFDRQELADYLEVDRSGLSSEISKLRREGILESEKKRFTML